MCTCVQVPNSTRTTAAIYANGGMVGDAVVQGALCFGKRLLHTNGGPSNAHLADLLMQIRDTRILV